MKPITALLVLLLHTAGATAYAKTYSAERYDSRLRIAEDGSLAVTETVVFRFEDGDFTYVFREIPTRRVDSIEVVGATMNGRPVAFGTEPGQVEVRGRSPVHVRWRFAPQSNSTHTFELTYIVRGVAQKAGNSDLLEWIALPTEHDYRIDSSEVVIETPAPVVSVPVIQSRRVEGSRLDPGGNRVQIQANGIGRDGWVKARLEFANSSIIAVAPQWQQRLDRARALAPRWATAALLIFVAGLVLFFGIRQGYDSPEYPSGSPEHSGDAPPDALRPALAGAVASNGGVSLHHAMSALFTLADRGVVTITEEPRKWGQRQFTVHRADRRRSAAPEEAALLTAAFTKKGQEEPSVRLDKARGRIAHGLGRFKKAVRQELTVHGLWHEDRARVRSRYVKTSFAFVACAAVAAVIAGTISGQFGGWGFLPAAALGALAIVGFAIYGVLTPLSNEGLRRRERWIAYRRHLKNVARDKDRLPRRSQSQILPFAIALGLAAAWSKFVKRYPETVPPWFRTMGADAGAFPAFVAAGGSGGGGGGAGGGAAGGGGSGAG